ncbi:uncharacterized protein LOC110690074 [Chenopodium quinoa]|uniref:uncharacterized protein LOC110690074 n=1 Tax=Chenopodium quinoa TaxID=63459 RepID=UPI000B77D2F1|nr:uncharacterized protein LOC110690074 [Chenopodium quinoa]
MSHHLQEKTIEELQILFEKEEDPDKLNEIMNLISEKGIASDNETEENNYVSLEEDLYQQMGLMKLDDLDFLPIEVVQQKIENKLEDWYDGVDEEVKTTLTASESPTRMFRQLCQYIELEFIGPRADPNEKRMKYQKKLSNLSICNMKYVDNYFMEFETYYYKIGENETNLGMFYNKLPSPLNEEISEKYQEWKEKFLARDALARIVLQSVGLVENFYANECKKANHKLMEALGSWDYIEIPEDEAFNLALSNNKGIVEIIEEENEYNEEPEDSEFEDGNYEEINNMMEGKY